MAIDFPTSPALNEIYTYGGRSWQWNGIAWDIYSTGTAGATGATGPQGNTGIQGNTGPVGDYVSTFNGSTGAVTGVTVGGTNIFTALNSFNAGISASALTVSGGATFAGNVSFQNAEFIRNTTNGRMDFMPAPAGSTHYGMYMDFTSWSWGVRLGTIRASDSALNAAGFLWDAPLSVNTDVKFNLGSDGQYNIVRTSTGNDTTQFVVNCSTGQNSGAFALVDNIGALTANRSPGVTHANPNLYVYRSGSARANDFIRVEHDGTNGRIVSGGTSGIKLEPGSGVVGISGSIDAVGATFSGNVITQSVLYTDNIENRTGQIYIDNTTSARVSIGEYAQNGNNTCIFLRDATSTLDITNPIGDIKIGDNNGYGGGQIIYNATSLTLSGNGTSNIIDFTSISATETLYENNRRVTTHARSWFL